VSGVIGGPVVPDFTIGLEQGFYHRIPTNVRKAAKVVVTISKAAYVRLDKVEAVIVRRGVDVTNGPFARRMRLLRRSPADGQRLSVTLPAVDDNGKALPPGQYMWGINVSYREVYTDTCGKTPAENPQPMETGQEMPFLLVTA